MKKYLNIFAFATLIPFVVTCSSDESNKATQSNPSKNAKLSAKVNGGSGGLSVVDYSRPNYQGQLQYLNGDHGDINDFKVDNDLDKKIADSQYDWLYFDKLYNVNLNTTQKQYLAYIILSKKDLLSEFNNSQTQVEADAILKYTNVLVQTNYFGYCLMYNCLNTLKNQTLVSVNINSLKQSILSNANAKQFHDGSIQHLSNYTSDAHSLEVLEKIKEDLNYLDDISNL